MLDLKLILKNFEEVEKRLSLRGEDYGLSEIRQLAEVRGKTQNQLDQLRSERNRLSKEIGRLFREGEKAQAERLKEQAGKISEQVKGWKKS